MRLSMLVTLAPFVVAACSALHSVNTFFTPHGSYEFRVNVVPDYDTGLTGKSALSAVRPPLLFRRGHFTDRRADTTRLASYQHNLDSYTILSERPPQDILYDGLRALLVQAGHTWSDTGASGIRVDLQLLSLQASGDMGLRWVAANSRIVIQVDFLSSDSSAMHAGIYSGEEQRRQTRLGARGADVAMVRASIAASLINCLNSVGGDTRLATALLVQP